MNTADMPQYGLVRDGVPGPAVVRAGPTFSKAREKCEFDYW